MQDPSFRSQALLGVVSSAPGCRGDQRSFFKKMFLYKVRGQEFPFFFFLVFIYVLLFSTETLPFYLYVLFSMALGKDLSVPRK